MYETRAANITRVLGVSLRAAHKVPLSTVLDLRLNSLLTPALTEDAIRNQYEFFTQRLGGPPLYSMRKGHPALRARHRNFVITTTAADRWIHHMKETLPDLSLSDEQRDILMEFFADVAYFLRNAN